MSFILESAGPEQGFLLRGRLIGFPAESRYFPTAHFLAFSLWTVRWTVRAVALPIRSETPAAKAIMGSSFGGAVGEAD